MRTLIPFFLLIALVTVFVVVLPDGMRKAMFTRRHISIALFVIVCWIVVLTLAVVQSNFTIPLF